MPSFFAERGGFGFPSVQKRKNLGRGKISTNMSEYRPDRALQESIEAERAELKVIARRVLTRLFQDALEVDELEKRLAFVDQVHFVTQAQMDAIAENNPQDAGADGLIQYEVSESGVRRIPVVLHAPSRAETLHTLVHEGTHLMTPEPALVINPMAEPGEETFSDHLGGLRLDRNRITKQLDPMSIDIDTPSRFLFWEAITDFLSEFGLVDEMSDEEQEEIETSGYFERYWIGYLVRKSPDPSGLIEAIQMSYVTGSEDPLRWCLQKQIGVQNDLFYDGLLRIIGRDRMDEKRVDDWMKVVDETFRSS